jgi:hypothetical protein
MLQQIGENAIVVLIKQHFPVIENFVHYLLIGFFLPGKNNVNVYKFFLTSGKFGVIIIGVKEVLC